MCFGWPLLAAFIVESAATTLMEYVMGVVARQTIVLQKKA